MRIKKWIFHERNVVKTMRSYYVMFYNGNNKVCGTWKRANNADDACIMAEFALMCHYPNVLYTSCKIVNEAE